jgi:hypothetical protein
MASTAKLVAGTVALVALLTGGIVGASMWHADRTSKRLTAEADAIGLVATPARWWDGAEEENVDGHTITFAYVGPANKVFTRRIDQVEWYDSKTRYKVCYNPQNGDDWQLYPDDHVCGE